VAATAHERPQYGLGGQSADAPDRHGRGYLSSDEGDNSVAVVFGMYVTSEHRGKGIGRLLLTSLIDRLSAFPHISTIRLGVTETQDPARRLYESVGFRVAGKTEEGIVVDDRRYVELIMELRVR
jgi:ribosomal protein S18 acetylase RimI-like enzyme